MEQAILLIVGLGNPGPQYAQTRHNAGEWFINELAHADHVNLSLEKKFKGESGLLHLKGHECHLLKPLTYMNLSGESVAAIANFYKIPPQAILVAHDELDLAPGIARLKKGGGHGGHNGLRSIIEKLGTADFLRLRLGIGHPGPGLRHLVSDYVLSKPSLDDKNKIDDAIAHTLPQVEKLLAGKIQIAMHELHSLLT